ncbi:MAG: peptide-methionine (S)-S-oxide reductase MsrA [Xanthomonadaceae bacterium]|nr:peptide-methionine (S)-S-oxide reductase MsrA [Xanthomonadaceae bacterium]MDE3071146.1 peptide-methionine (S)-S-oxide reductase MsrA [Pseudomonadota bacterium]
MIRRTAILPASIAALLMLAVSACQPASAAGGAVRLPAPGVDAPRVAAQTVQTAVLAGGCFWGVESVFEHVKGVRRVVAGYAGGSARTAHYDQVSEGDTGHAESVRVRFDPAQISYGQLLQVFFSVALDPTQLDRQGPDSGTQYRSAIFYANDEQKKVAAAYIAQLTAARSFAAPIVTQVVPLQAFYPAEAYHQHYARRHPDDPYIVYNDAPKVAHLKQLFPELYRPERQVVEVRLH